MAGFEAHAGAYEEAGVGIVALSADDESGARSMKDDEGLSFPVLFGLDVDDMRDRYGLYINKNGRTHLQPAQFIVGPEGDIRLACYSSGKVGRLSAEEALDQVNQRAADGPARAGPRSTSRR